MNPRYRKLSLKLPYGIRLLNMNGGFIDAPDGWCFYGMGQQSVRIYWMKHVLKYGIRRRE